MKNQLTEQQIKKGGIYIIKNKSNLNAISITYNLGLKSFVLLGALKNQDKNIFIYDILDTFKEAKQAFLNYRRMLS